MYVSTPVCEGASWKIAWRTPICTSPAKKDQKDSIKKLAKATWAVYRIQGKVVTSVSIVGGQ